MKKGDIVSVYWNTNEEQILNAVVIRTQESPGELLVLREDSGKEIGVNTNSSAFDLYRVEKES